MADIVVDASALAALAFGEADGPAVERRLAGRALRAPSLLWYEMANVCVTKMRRQPQDADRLRDRLSRARDLRIQIHQVPPLAAVAVAEETGLSAYDAAYLWLARHLGADLVTLDERLAAACEG
jgi:predicted nucleic acid-binding protein